MLVIEILAALGTIGLTIAICSAIALGYVAFYNYRTVMAGLAGFAGGSLLGVVAASGYGVVASGLVGTVGGVAAARYHPRGGSLVTAGGFGLGVGVFLGLIWSPLAGIAVGAGLGVGLATIAWRFPRTALVPATGAVPVLAAIGFYFLYLAAVGTDVISRFLDSTEGVALVAMFPILFGIGSYICQPYYVQSSRRVPPLWPERLRRLFGDEPYEGDYGIRCQSCGAIGDPGHERCHACGTVSKYDAEHPAQTEDVTAPDDAVAVNIPCPHCGERPIEEGTRAYQLTGLVLLYRWRSIRVVGCHDCVSSRLRRTAAKTMVTGWWSITTFLVNPFLIVWNLGRSLYNRGPTDALATALAESGLPRDWLTDRADFDPEENTGDELLVDALIEVGCRVMLADGTPSQSEAAVIRDTVLETFPEYDADEIESRIQSAAERDGSLEAATDGLSALLTRPAREAVLALAAQVAAAKGEIGTDEKRQFQTLANELDVDLDPAEIAMTGGIGEYVEDVS
ncbi:TerB family tellurite resistance protein [Halorhabdus sp. BNX81]|uniref:TerB family tellurite resistance protein n=1 Tax=Halorhabdus sp. BNX81 TaxID=2980181 RepID=UPI0023DD6087|nr:TerB family tellurite resistance protein [Halorhabdus sp. BNX81]WEL22396.1 hypothetical protein HBNXHr_2353 [Halorhabdus sp. BNX81]